jgi:hypothetical protein
MPAIQSSVVIGKNEDGSDITQDVDVLVWWRHVGQARERYGRGDHVGQMGVSQYSFG